MNQEQEFSKLIKLKECIALSLRDFYKNANNTPEITTKDKLQMMTALLMLASDIHLMIYDKEYAVHLASKTAESYIDMVKEKLEEMEYEKL